MSALVELWAYRVVGAAVYLYLLTHPDSITVTGLAPHFDLAGRAVNLVFAVAVFAYAIRLGIGFVNSVRRPY